MDKGRMILKDGERIDDLQRGGCRLIQNPDLFCFGIDATFLAAYAKAGSEEKVLDLCTGNGIIPVLLAGRGKGKSITGIELQELSVDIAKRNVILNEFEEKINIIRGDIKDADKIAGRDSFDVVTCNPPYMLKGDGLINPDNAKALARHEILCDMDDVSAVTSKVLKVGGRLYLVHRPRRLTEIFRSLKANKLEPKRMRMVHSFADKEAVLVLIEAVKGAGIQLIVQPPLIIYESPGEYTEEVRSLYFSG